MPNEPIGLERPATKELLARIGHELLFQGDEAEVFNLPSDAPICDVVMKGGVTSGIVYPYGMLRLAQHYRLAGIGGTSAGAIAAALTAAAEYARQTRGDHEGFARLESWCCQLPKLMRNLFQPYDEQRGLFDLLTMIMESADKGVPWHQRLFALRRMLTTRAWSYPVLTLVLAILVGCFASGGDIKEYVQGQNPVDWPMALARAIGTSALMAVLAMAALFLATTLSVTLRRRSPLIVLLSLVVAVCAVAPWMASYESLLAIVVPAALGGGLGAIVGASIMGELVTHRLRNRGFGVCSGLAPPGAKTPAITDWLHDAIQDVARPPNGRPLTFQDVETAGPGGRKLRMITTNLSLGCPYALPDLGAGDFLGWKPSEWKDLFPPDVIAYLKTFNPEADDDKPRPLPSGPELPVLVGARMSLSFPLLFTAVPIYAMSRQGRLKHPDPMLLVDGGLSSNLPLHFFDRLGPPVHPTFAFSLDDAPRSATFDERVRLPMSYGRPPPFSPRGYSAVVGFMRGLLNAAKDWQDNLMSVMPGQFERIVRIGLKPGEGGMNLTMPPARSDLLMQLGYKAGDELVLHFDLPSHRVRRALAAYQEIERVAYAFGEGWRDGSLRAALEKEKGPVGARRAWRASGAVVLDRFELTAQWGLTLHPPEASDHFPKPRGTLRITPNLSGDI